jgi:hypothetical protein
MELTGPLVPVTRRKFDIEDIRGVPSDRLVVGAHGDATITYIDERAGFHNSLFVYLIDADGRLRDPRPVWADASDSRADPAEPRERDGSGPLSPGDSVRLSEIYGDLALAPGQRFGLLLVQNGWKRNPHELFDDRDGFRLIDRRTGENATLDTDPRHIRLVHEGDDGRTKVRGRLFFTSDPGDDGTAANPLNPDRLEHVVSAPGERRGETWLAFEDLDYHDRNFADLTLLVDISEPEHLCPLPLDARHLAGGIGSILQGVAVGDRTGLSVAVLGDFDGDGFTDFAIGAPEAGGDARGAVHIVFGAGGRLPDLVQLAGGDGVVTLEGSAAGDRLGTSVAAAGDVNGDGLADLVVGAIGVDGGGADSGAAYVVYGGARPAAGSIEALPAERLLRVDGLEAGDELGRSVAGGADVDGDGFDDILIGARLAEADYARYSGGLSYLLFGGEGGPVGDLADLDGTNGIRIEGRGRFDQSGRSVAMLGDVNGDGLADFAVGAPDADPGGRENAGEAYVVFGTAAGFPASLDPGTLDGRTGFVIEGAAPGDFAGFAVARAGDVDGDGFDDILIGAYGRTNASGEGAGAAYLVFGRADGFPARLDLGALDGTNGFVMEGLAAFDGTGRSVAGAGDVNGDGFDDILVGARYADPGAAGGEGKVYLVYGHAGPFDASLDLSALDPDRGCTLVGTRTDGYAGFSFGGPGDIDGDGFDDMLIGAPAVADAGLPGEVYVVWGGGHFGPDHEVLLTPAAAVT